MHELGLKVAVHAILGLPGETAKDFQQTADTLAALPIDAVKIHNLHIEKGTTLALENALTPLPVLMERDFAEHLMDFIRRVPPNIPIMRLTTDTLDEELIAPKWNMAKGQFKDSVIQQLVCRDWKPGDLWRGEDAELKGDRVEEALREPETLPPFSPVETSDGSTTFWNSDVKEHYHTPAGARLEAEKKYLAPGKLKERLARGDVQLLDVCFGLGYNSLAAMELAINAQHALDVTALEMDRRVVGAAAENIQSSPTDSFDWKRILRELHHHQESRITPQSAIVTRWGDARHTITKLESGAYDLVFLDAFSTQRNSELWTVDFFRELKRVMKPDAVLLTYCAAIPVRSGLMEAGFFVGETDPIGRARGGTLAALRAEDVHLPLPEHETRLIRETTRGLPYRDPNGVWTNKEILRDRQERILVAKEEP